MMDSEAEERTILTREETYGRINIYIASDTTGECRKWCESARKCNESVLGKKSGEAGELQNAED